jgi:hypothetical protein
MRHAFTSAAVAVAVALAEVVAFGQGKDPAQILGNTRAALGGDTLAAVKTLSGSGRMLRTMPNGNSMETEFEVFMDLPDKYVMHSVLAAVGNMSVYRNSGFNGGQVIEETDRPPNLQGGNVVIHIVGPGGAVDPDKMTPEERAALDRTRLLGNRREFARLALGMFGAPPAVFPLELSYGGEAEAPDGRAWIVGLKGEGDFNARLFVDQKSGLPLMLTWMAREPIIVQSGSGGGGGAVGGGGGAATFSSGGGSTVTQRIERGNEGRAPSPDQLEKLKLEMEAKRKEAEARARVVEFRLYYGDYQTVNGVKLPFRLQRSVDGKPTEEMVFDQYKVNPKIDPRKFSTSK